MSEETIISMVFGDAPYDWLAAVAALGDGATLRRAGVTDQMQAEVEGAYARLKGLGEEPPLFFAYVDSAAHGPRRVGDFPAPFEECVLALAERQELRLYACNAAARKISDTARAWWSVFRDTLQASDLAPGEKKEVIETYFGRSLENHPPLSEYPLEDDLGKAIASAWLTKRLTNPKRNEQLLHLLKCFEVTFPDLWVGELSAEMHSMLSLLAEREAQHSPCPDHAAIDLAKVQEITAKMRRQVFEELWASWEVVVHALKIWPTQCPVRSAKDLLFEIAYL